MASGPASILYSAYLKPLSTEHILVAAGTVFGEIHVWSCHTTSGVPPWRCTPHYNLTGHRGSIFGVCISDEYFIDDARRRLLASCSDDRTIRVWDITKCSINFDCNTFGTAAAPPTTTTGFVEHVLHGEGSELTVAWAHLSRIWDVLFLPSPKSESCGQILLASLGEDAMCQLWGLSLDPLGRSCESTQLAVLQNDRHHAGKNIWSVAFDSTQISTGGADGSIVVRRYLSSKPIAGGGSRDTYDATFQEVFKACSDLNGSTPIPVISAHALKQYLLMDTERLLATTDSGHLLQGMFAHDGSLMSWELLYSGSRRSPLLLCNNSADEVAFVAEENKIMVVMAAKGCIPTRILDLHFNVNAQITWMHVAWTDHEAVLATSQFCLVTAIRASSKMRVFWVAMDGFSSHSQETEVELPATFAPTSALYHPRSRLLIIGSRAGAVAVYANFDRSETAFQSPLCIRHVHGTDTVTSITTLEPWPQSMDERQEAIHILTTGRDGAYSVHRINTFGQKSSMPSDFETVHISCPPFGPNIEGAYLSRRNKNSFQIDLMLYGFRSKDFVVWNESCQTEDFLIECGGAHRSWAYSPRANEFTNTSAGPGGAFIWTKAGSVHSHIKDKVEHSFIQAGGHGREIKALAKYPGRYSDPNKGINDAMLVATGAEDTAIRFFAISTPSPSSGGFLCVRVLKQHTTGLQHLQFSNCGEYLFSSAGCDEFFVWKLRTNVPCIGIGVILQDSLPKDAADSDARLTSFNIKENSGSGTETLGRKPFLISAAYSNGKVMIFRYTPDVVGAGRFEILSEMFEGQFCLLQVQLTDVCSEYVEFISSGTNGRLNIGRVTLSGLFAPPIQSLRAQIHQNSIKTLKTVRLINRLQLIMTGGDDNALGLTLFQPRDDLNSEDAHNSLQTLLIPKAHAAAITALSVVRISQHSTASEVILVSTGNDQRVKVWQLTVCHHWRPKSSSAGDILSGMRRRKSDSDDMVNLMNLQVEKLGEVWTNVADIGDMDVIDNAKNDTGVALELGLLIVGVGMEMMKLQFHGLDEKEVEGLL
jgi:WD repeat-containing protein 6